MVGKPPPSKKSLTQEAVGGLAAGIVGTVIGFPLDTIKARMQVIVGAGSSSHHPNNSSGLLHTGWNIVRTEKGGFRALYRGLLPPLISLSILNTYTFSAYSYFHSTYQATRGWDVRNALAGASVGLFCGTVSTVENLVKTQVQLDNVSAQRYHGSLDAVKQLVRYYYSPSPPVEGQRRGTTANNTTFRPWILYTGHMVNTARETMFLATYFGIYEGVRAALKHYHHDADYFAIPAVAGGLSGAISWFVTFPLDCVRAGVQGQDLMTTRRADRKSAMQVFRNLMQTKGIRGLYSGVSPSIVRAVLVSASRFSAYEGVLWLLRGERGD